MSVSHLVSYFMQDAKPQNAEVELQKMPDTEELTES